MTQVDQLRATLRDLYREPGKAELIDGRIVRLMATGSRPNLVAGQVYRSLADYADERGGVAYTDNVAFTVPRLPNGRESFSPDAAYYSGRLPPNPMRFVEGPPTLAVEVRSENDYSPSAEEAIRAKRADYFEAGARVVWDVDPLAETIRVYRASDPQDFTLYRRGDVSEADPAVPGWRVAVDWLFR